MTETDPAPTRPIWPADDKKRVQIIDQRMLPHNLVIVDLTTVDQVIEAIGEMMVRGAPLIGVTGAFGVFIAVQNALERGDFEAHLKKECLRIKEARPTAVNLAWGVDRVCAAVFSKTRPADCLAAALAEASAIAEEEVDNCRRIGEHGVGLIEAISREKGGKTVNVLTHCNAGWLACVEHGTATAPIYKAFEKGIDIHVWVDETRPLNQGARLTAWELGQRGVAHTVITDNAGGHLMQHGMVDMVIVGTDRSTYTGDVANKIGTYLKALAARDNNIPFYVALPSSTFDWEMTDGLAQIPIEKRNPDEVRCVEGLCPDGRVEKVRIVPENCRAANYAFDVTPARLVTGFITERGVCGAGRDQVLALFPEKR